MIAETQVLEGKATEKDMERAAERVFVSTLDSRVGPFLSDGMVKAYAPVDHVKERYQQAMPWSSDMKWQAGGIVIQANTYRVFNLFPGVKPSVHHPRRGIKHGEAAFSGKRQFCYMNRIFPPSGTLSICSGLRQSWVAWDGPVIIPVLFEKWGHAGDENDWREEPWMSLTPNEIWTMRVGTRKAKGHTVVAGLGLGYQLIGVDQRKQVDRITVVERSQELADWLWPILSPEIKHKVELIIGDAYEVLPKLAADVALIDIYPGYGYNTHEHQKFVKTCPNIKTLWSWGAYG